MKSLSFTLSVFISVLVLASCGGPKGTISGTNSPTAEIDKQISSASLKLEKNPNNEKQIAILRDAYKRATDQDLALVESLRQQAATDASKWVDVFDVYDRMLIREIAVKPLLPLYIAGGEVPFDIPDVDRMAEDSKSKASNYLYNEGVKLLATGKKEDARKAYALFDQLMEFNYSFQDAEELRRQAKYKGSINAVVTVENKTGRALPAGFENDVLNFRTEGFTNEWVAYHNTPPSGIPVDYDIKITVNELLVGRNDEQRRQYREQKQVVVGYRQGRDSQGNPVRIPQYGTVYADVLEITQLKPIRLKGTMTYLDKRTGQQVASLPIEREEAWGNVYAQFRGDQRALSQETIQKIQNGQKQYPPDSWMLEQAGKLLNQNVVKLLEENSGNLK